MSKPANINEKYQIPDSLWEKIEPIIEGLPKKEKKKPGRPKMDDRQALNAILYLMYTGCQWKALPRCLGASSTVHDRFQYWANLGLFAILWHEGLLQYDLTKGIDWAWQAADGAQVQAPLGGQAVGPSYKHRGKNGTNRSVLTDGQGVPLAMSVAQANCNDFKLLRPTLEAFAIPRPCPNHCPQNLCLDKGYDCLEIDELVASWGYTAHIRRKGEVSISKAPIPGYRARRWVVERTHSWMNHFRRLIILWEIKETNFLALLHFACAWISYRTAEVF